jgi:cbb3-type cytochrome oxidase maturation protein
MLIDLMVTLAGGLAGLVIFFYYWRKGQFDDCEDVKYQMFRDEEDDSRL